MELKKHIAAATANRMASVGVVTIDDLLSLTPKEINALPLGVNGLKDVLRLVVNVAGVRGKANTAYYAEVIYEKEIKARKYDEILNVISKRY